MHRQASIEINELLHRSVILFCFRDQWGVEDPNDVAVIEGNYEGHH